MTLPPNILPSPLTGSADLPSFSVDVGVSGIVRVPLGAMVLSAPMLGLLGHRCCFLRPAISTPRSLPETSTAVAVSYCGEASVLQCEGMPMRAVGCQPALKTSSQIDASADGFQMGRINAMSETTEMVPVKAIGGFTHKKVVSLDLSSSLYDKRAISMLILGAQPEPASSQVGANFWHWPILVHLQPEGDKTLCGGEWLWGHRFTSLVDRFKYTILCQGV